jgi:hypothetical protein
VTDFPHRARCLSRGCGLDARYEIPGPAEFVGAAHARTSGHRVEILAKDSPSKVIEPDPAIGSGREGDRG